MTARTREATYQSIGEPAEGDELQGQWPRHRVVAMDTKFAERLERAIELGQEHHPKDDRR